MGAERSNCPFYKIQSAQIAALVKNYWLDAIHIIPIDCTRRSLTLSRCAVHHFINH